MIGIRVTVEDLETGDTERMVIADDYIIVTAGRCYLAHTQTYANGTHQLTVKGRADSKPAARSSSRPLDGEELGSQEPTRNPQIVT